MSDDDMMLSEEEEDYGFEYEDASDPEEDDVMVNLENQYYAAKGTMMEDDEHEALRLFNEVVQMEQEKGDWCTTLQLY